MSVKFTIKIHLVTQTLLEAGLYLHGCVQERTTEELAEDETIDCNIVEFLKEKVDHLSPLINHRFVTNKLMPAL